MNLTEFLLARITEHEAVTESVIRRYSNGEIANSGPFGHPLGVAISPSDQVISTTCSRVLAECAAKRAIVAEHAPMPCENERHQNGLHCAVCEYDVISRGWHPCPTLRFLALPYADHPDFQPEWKP